MKKTSFLLLVVTSFNGYAVDYISSCQLQDLIYFGYTLDHTKAVELCKFKNKDNSIRYKYSFGPIGFPEMVIIKEKPFINFNGSKYGGFQVDNGTFTYNIVNGKNDKSTLYIENNDVIVTTIKIDTMDSSYTTHTFSMMLD